MTRQQCCKGCQGPVLRAIQVRPQRFSWMHAPPASLAFPVLAHAQSPLMPADASLSCCKPPCYLGWHCLAFTDLPRPFAHCSALGGWGRGKQRQSSPPAALLQLQPAARSPLPHRGVSSPPARCAANGVCCPGGHTPGVPAKWPQPPPTLLL